MSVVEAFILGVTQGLTEFLPVSSSAHLVFVQHLLGFKEPMLFFDVTVHLGTLLSLILYFSKEVACLLRDSIYGIFFLLRRKPMKEIAELAPFGSWALALLVASIPTGLMGVWFKDWFESLFGSLQAVGLALFGTSVILWLTMPFQKGEKRVENTRLLDLLTIGIFQGVAIIPGISRSGATISAALFRGLKREDAFRFSFLLAIPAILGAALLELKEGIASWPWGWPVLAAGFLSSALLGYFSLHFLARVTQKGKLHLFGIYTFLFAILVLAVSSRLE